MVAHISTLYSVVINLINKSDEEKQREWEKIESNVSRQLPLRVLSVSFSFEIRDNSFLGGGISKSTLYLMSWIIGFTTEKYKKVGQY